MGEREERKWAIASCGCATLSTAHYLTRLASCQCRALHTSFSMSGCCIVNAVILVLSSCCIEDVQYNASTAVVEKLREAPLPVPPVPSVACPISPSLGCPLDRLGLPQSLEPSSLSTRCMMGSCASLYGLSLLGISNTVGMTFSYVLSM